jgi:RNA polymerase sigma-70 factor (ECF subfamily)
MVKRARQKIHAEKPKRSVNPDDHERLLKGFIAASSEDSMDRFAAILAEDAVFYTDHGGKAIANKRAIFGADKISRFVLGIRRRFAPDDYRLEVRTINGMPGLVAFEGDAPSSAMTFDIADGRIQNIYTVRNPEKLAGLRRS